MKVKKVHLKCGWDGAKSLGVKAKDHRKKLRIRGMQLGKSRLPRHIRRLRMEASFFVAGRTRGGRQSSVVSLGNYFYPTVAY
jgi:hypothetical protein